jgi:hypothetical protein
MNYYGEGFGGIAGEGFPKFGDLSGPKAGLLSF